MITFNLVTLNGVKFGDLVHEVILPTPDGQIAVFTDHMPLVSLVSPGVISIRKKDKDPDDFMEHYATNGGVVEIGENHLRVLVDEADQPDEISAAEAQKALEQAQKLRAEAKDQVSLDTAQGLIDRQAVRLKVAGLRRHNRR